MKAFLTTILSKRLAAALIAAIAFIQQHKWWEACGVVIAYLASEGYRPTPPKV